MDKSGFMKKAGLLKRARHQIRTPLIRLLFGMFTRIPLAVSHKIGAFIGWCLWIFNGSMRAVSEHNVRQCLPEYSEDKQQRLVKKSLIETGKTMFEVPFLWAGDKTKFSHALKRVEGFEYVEQALSKGKGLILFTPHLGAWETAGLFFSQQFPMVTMYRPSHVEGVDDLIQAGRTRFGTRLVATDLKGIKQLYQALKAGEVLGMLPDQDPGRNGGEFAPFFGINANTMTLANRILNKSGAAAVFCFAKRLPQGKGYEIKIYPAPDAMASNDVYEGIAAMNVALERVIRECPEQYQWSYKRFKTRPIGEPKFYQ